MNCLQFPTVSITKQASLYGMEARLLMASPAFVQAH